MTTSTPFASSSPAAINLVPGSVTLRSCAASTQAA